MSSNLSKLHESALHFTDHQQWNIMVKHELVWCIYIYLCS